MKNSQKFRLFFLWLVELHFEKPRPTKRGFFNCKLSNWHWST